METDYESTDVKVTAPPTYLSERNGGSDLAPTSAVSSLHQLHPAPSTGKNGLAIRRQTAQSQCTNTWNQSQYLRFLTLHMAESTSCSSTESLPKGEISFKQLSLGDASQCGVRARLGEVFLMRIGRTRGLFIAYIGLGQRELHYRRLLLYFFQSSQE